MHDLLLKYINLIVLSDMANGSSDLPTLLGVASGIAVLAGLICMVLHLFSKNKYPRHRGHFADTHLPPPILYSSDTGMRLLWLRCRLSDCPRALSPLYLLNVVPFNDNFTHHQQQNTRACLLAGRNYPTTTTTDTSNEQNQIRHSFSV